MFDIKRIEDAAMRFPRLWDTLVRVYPRPANPLAFELFDRFSRAHSREVGFVQIGASDGMRCDPIREFVVRDGWRGIFVEPLPEAFRMLEENYAYLAGDRLQFVQAAISDARDPLEFWTFTEGFLRGLPIGDRMSYLRKSSFDRSHVERQVGGHDPDEVLVKISVPVLTLNQLLREHAPDWALDVLVIDAEGHEATIIESADLEAIRPRLIFFESHNLGDDAETLPAYLERLGYRLETLGGDTAALLES